MYLSVKVLKMGCSRKKPLFKCVLVKLIPSFYFGRLYCLGVFCIPIYLFITYCIVNAADWGYVTVNYINSLSGGHWVKVAFIKWTKLHTNASRIKPIYITRFLTQHVGVIKVLEKTLSFISTNASYGYISV